VVSPHQIRLFTVQIEALARSGASLVDITASGTCTLRKAGNAAAPCPPARDGVYLGNRAWLVYGDDLMVASDILDPIHYHRVSNEFRANVGSADPIVTVAPFNESTIIILKKRSVLALTGVYGDLSALRLTEITREYGCVAADSVANLGADLVWLSQRGVVSLRQTEEGISQAVVLPLSDEVQGYMDQIAWRNVDLACAAYHGNRYILSMPLEENPYVNGATLVYNFLTRAWEGMWRGELLNPIRFVGITYSGRPTLAFIDSSQRLHMFSETDGVCDQCANGFQIPIATEIKTRGYRHASIDRKRFVRLDVEVASHAPRYTMEARWDGLNEVQPLVSDQERDRTEFLTYGRGHWVPDNSGDDFWEEGRADYSLLPGFSLGTNGVALAQQQRFTHSLRIGRRGGAAVQLSLTSDQGEVEVVLVRGEAIPEGNAGYSKH
jgi:hypothetical protein